VQLTWRDNYRNATAQLGLTGDDDLEWHAAQALDPTIATTIIFEGMREGWFTGKMLPDYFNETEDDPVGARQIVNDHDHDDDIAEIHHGFLLALQGAQVPDLPRVMLALKVPDGVAVSISINDVPLIMSPRDRK
jgi:putative chitinase